MTDFELASLLISLAALFSYINYRFFNLPQTIGVMTIALFASIILLVFGAVNRNIATDVIHNLLKPIDLHHLVLDVLLGFLLFAGALHVNLNDLIKERLVISFFATFSLLVTTLIVGTSMFLILPFFGITINFLYCLAFGALISPTDPVAVIGVIRRVGGPRNLETKIVGESLFNDGFGVVIFLIIVAVLTSRHELLQQLNNLSGISKIGLTLIREVGGGLVLGAILGAIGFLLLRTIEDHRLEILITLALTSGGYAIGSTLHVSAPLSMVVLGLFIGNQGRYLAMSAVTRKRLDAFWELVDEFLNAVLFLLIGLELFRIPFSSQLSVPIVLVSLISIPVVLVGRFTGIGLPITLLRWSGKVFDRMAIRIITWAGLRGGISVALALSLPNGQERSFILLMTYAVVIFSIIIQGLTLGRLIRKTVI